MVDIVAFKKHLLREYRKTPKLLRSFVKWSVIIAIALWGDIALLLLLGTLTASNLINWNTVISFLVVELLAATIAKLFKIGGPSEAEEKNQKIAFAASKAQFSHLLIVFISGEGYNNDYPYSHYRVVNTRTKLCYYVPSILEPLVEEETILNEIKKKNEKEWENYLNENRFIDKRKFPDNEELGVWTNEAPVQKEEALYRDYII